VFPRERGSAFKTRGRVKPWVQGKTSEKKPFGNGKRGKTGPAGVSETSGSQDDRVGRDGGGKVAPPDQADPEKRPKKKRIYQEKERVMTSGKSPSEGEKKKKGVWFN